MNSKKRIILIVLLSMLIVVISSICSFADEVTFSLHLRSYDISISHSGYTWEIIDLFDNSVVYSRSSTYNQEITVPDLVFNTDHLYKLSFPFEISGSYQNYYHGFYKFRIAYRLPNVAAIQYLNIPVNDSSFTFTLPDSAYDFVLDGYDRGSYNSNADRYFSYFTLKLPTLPTPSIEYSSDQNGVHLTWAPVVGALSYKFNYGGTSYNIGNVTSYTISDFGEYTLQAVGANSILSDPTPKIVYRQIQPVAGSFSNVGGNLIFEKTYPSETEDVSGYVPQYSYNNSDWVNTTMVVYDSTVPNYRVTLADQPAYYHMVAYDIMSGVLTEDKAFDVSRPTDSFYYDGTSVQPLVAPVLTLNDTLLSWTYPPGTTSSTVFEVYCNGSRVKTLTGNTYTITQSGVWYVRALGSGAYSTSPTSNQVVYNSVPLPSPSVYSIYNPETGYNILIWNKVEGARGYEIYKDGIKISNPSITDYMATSYQYTATSAGTYYVIALSDDSFHSSSLASNSVIIETNTSGTVDPVISVADVILNAVKSILNLASYLGTFVAVFGNIFAFLPPEVKSLFITFLVAGIGINVMKWFV